MERLTVKGVDRIAPAIAALPAGDARQEAFERALGTLVGKSLPVAVLARLSDGSFLVRVAEHNARMALPASTQPGTEVPMTLVSTHPRPAFQPTGGSGQLLHPTLVTQEFGELRSAGAAAVAAFRAQLTPAGDGAAAPRNAQVSLSAAGRAIAGILGALGAPAGQTASVSSPAPLGGPGTPDPQRLAQSLEAALAHSGLFYESHVAEWAAGKRTLPELQREPQMQTALAAAGSKDAGALADPALAQLVSQQLATHENARLVWQGQPWPGQDLRWEIHKDAPERGQRDGGAAEPGWRSTLRLRFPGLGEIAATVVMAGGQLHIQLTAGSNQTGAVLRAHSAELVAALGAAGGPPAALDINFLQKRVDG